MELLLNAACEAGADALHEPSRRLLRDLNKHVDVIGHPAVPVNACARMRERARHDRIQRLAIGVLEEDVASVISAGRDVVHLAPGTCRRGGRAMASVPVIWELQCTDRGCSATCPHERLQHDVRRAVAIRRFQPIAHVSPCVVSESRSTVDGRAAHVAREPFNLRARVRFHADAGV